MIRVAALLGLLACLFSAHEAVGQPRMGLTYGTAGIGEKYVELLHQAVPRAARVAVLARRAPDQTVQTNVRDAARALSVELLPIVPVKGPEEFETFFASARRDGWARSS
jgi:hypothetical protein